MNEPFINVEENIGKVVGRRTQAPNALESGMKLQALAAQLHASFKHRWPKGVYRFKTHEEADEWMNRMLARSQIPKNSSPAGQRFASGQSVTRTALPDADPSLLGWSGDADGMQTNLGVVMNPSRTMTAHFTRHPRFLPGPCRSGLREDGFQFTLGGDPGARSAVGRAPDLRHWAALLTKTNTFGMLQCVDGGATNGGCWFCRVLPGSER